MYQKSNFYFALIFFSFQQIYFSQNKNSFCKELVLKSLKSIDEISGLKYYLKIIERGKKNFNHYESTVKLNRSPKQIYIYIKGIEVLWRQGENKNKALVKPSGFPFFSINLDPMGDLMRQDQHHTLLEMGYDYFADIIQNTIDRLGHNFDNVFTCQGEEKINNRLCYKILIDNKNFEYQDYVIGEGENVTSIARKFHVSEYMIVEKNRKLNDYFDELRKGQVIKVPNWYGKHVVYYIDKFYFVPISMRVEDETGIFEEYNYHFLQVNPKFEEAEFTRKYKDYHF